MPRPRARPLFELGGHWISREPDRDGFYHYWNDAGAGRTRRKKLSAVDFEDAKAELAQIVLVGAKKTDDSHLCVVLENYFREKTDHLVSAKSARNAGRLFGECWGALFKARSLKEESVKRFVGWSLDKNHALSTVSRNLGVLAAALAHASLKIEVIYNENAILAKWLAFSPKPVREIFEPTDDELVRLLGAEMPENLRRWILNSIATGGRPEAVLGLAPSSRVRDLGLIDLNPKGRRQNKKYRPTVREPSVQTEWLDLWESGENEKVEKAKAASPEDGHSTHPYCGYAGVDSIDTALRRVCAKASVALPLLSVYSFRHRVASVLRASKDPRVPGEQISYQLGHRRPGDRTTRRYGAYEPDYLEEASAALDGWIRRLVTLSSTNSHTNSHNGCRRTG